MKQKSLFKKVKTGKGTSKGGLLPQSQYPKAKGKIAYNETGRGHSRIKRRCPVHHCAGYQTDWRPPLGMDPNLREYECLVGKHAFYEAG